MTDESTQRGPGSEGTEGPFGRPIRNYDSPGPDAEHVEITDEDGNPVPVPDQPFGAPVRGYDSPGAGDTVIELRDEDGNPVPVPDQPFGTPVRGYDSPGPEAEHVEITDEDGNPVSVPDQPFGAPVRGYDSPGAGDTGIDMRDEDGNPVPVPDQPFGAPVRGYDSPGPKAEHVEITDEDGNPVPVPDQPFGAPVRGYDSPGPEAEHVEITDEDGNPVPVPDRPFGAPVRGYDSPGAGDTVIELRDEDGNVVGRIFRARGVGTVELSEEDADLVRFELRLAPAAEPGAKAKWELSTQRAPEPDAAPADAAVSGARVSTEPQDSAGRDAGVRGFRLRMRPEESAWISEIPVFGGNMGQTPGGSPIYLGFEAVSLPLETAAQPGATAESPVFTRAVNWEAVLVALGDGEPPLDPAALVGPGWTMGEERGYTVWDVALDPETVVQVIVPPANANDANPPIGQWYLMWIDWIHQIAKLPRTRSPGREEESDEARRQQPRAGTVPPHPWQFEWTGPDENDPDPYERYFRGELTREQYLEIRDSGTVEGVDADKRAVDPPLDPAALVPVTGGSSQGTDPGADIDGRGLSERTTQWLRQLNWTSFSIQRQKPTVDDIIASIRARGYEPEEESDEARFQHPLADPIRAAEAMAGWVAPGDRDPSPNVSKPSGQGTFEGVDADERAVDLSAKPLTMQGGGAARPSSGSLVDLLTHPLRSVRSLLTLATLLAAVVAGAVFLSQGGGGESSLTTTPGQSSAAQTSPGQTSPGQTPPGQTSPGQTSPSGSSSGGSTSPGAPEGATPTVRRQTLDSRSVAPQPVTCDTGTPADAPGNQIRLAAIRVNENTGNPEVEVRFAASQEAAFEGDDSKALHLVAGPNIPEEADSRLAEQHGVFADPANVHYVMEQHLGTVLMGRLQNGVLTPDANLVQIRGDSVFFTIPELDVSAGEHRLLLLAFNSPDLGPNPTGPEFCTEALVTYEG